MKRTVAAAMACVMAVAGMAVGCGSSTSSASKGGSGSSGDGSSGGADLTPKVAGTMKDSVFISGDAESRRNLRVTKVFCRWNGDEVEMGATFMNGQATHITIHIQPNYRLKRAGLHGDGVGSRKDAGVDAGATRKWTAKIGNPDNVDGRPAITSCEPEINGVDLG